MRTPGPGFCPARATAVGRVRFRSVRFSPCPRAGPVEFRRQVPQPVDARLLLPAGGAFLRRVQLPLRLLLEGHGPGQPVRVFVAAEEQTVKIAGLALPEAVAQLPRQVLPFRDGVQHPTVRFATATSLLRELATIDPDSLLQRKLRFHARQQLLAIDEVGYLSYSSPRSSGSWRHPLRAARRLHAHRPTHRRCRVYGQDRFERLCAAGVPTGIRLEPGSDLQAVGQPDAGLPVRRVPALRSHRGPRLRGARAGPAGRRRAGIRRGCATGVSPQAEASPLSSAGARAGTAELSSDRDFRRP